MIARAYQPIDRRTDRVDDQVAVYDDDGRLVFLTANPAGDAVRLDDEARRLDAIVAALRHHVRPVCIFANTRKVAEGAAETLGFTRGEWRACTSIGQADGAVASRVVIVEPLETRLRDLARRVAIKSRAGATTLEASDG